MSHSSPLPADLSILACAMDRRSADRYDELAEAFDIACNGDTAQAFRRLAEWERQNAAAHGLSPQPDAAFPWGEDLSEIADPEAVHYLMWPWHAYDLAVEYERRALAHFQQAAIPALAERTTARLAVMTQWRNDSPQPPDDWADDDDPPNWDM